MKKGFTIIEIIISVSLIVVITVGSFVGIRLVDKKILVDKLNQITDKATLAAQVYIETNKSVSNQLYQNKNGVSLPLQLLVNEGLLSLDGTKLNNEDIKNQYVITFLGKTGESGTDNCEQITSTTSWGNDKEIYLCMNSDGSSNLATIDPTKYSNKTNVANEPYYFTGFYPHNYVKYNDANKLQCNLYRRYNNHFIKNLTLGDFKILYVDRDDTITLVAKDNDNSNSSYYIKCSFEDKDIDFGVRQGDVINTITNYNSTELASKESWLGYLGGETPRFNYNIKLRLPNSCKIKSGTGASDNPFQIDC